MPFGSKIQKKVEHTSDVEHTTPANNLGTSSLLQLVSTGANSLLPHDVMRLQRTVGELDEGPHKAGLSERERRFMFGQKGVDEDVSGEKLTWEEGGTRFTI